MAVVYTLESFVMLTTSGCWARNIMMSCRNQGLTTLTFVGARPRKGARKGARKGVCQYLDDQVTDPIWFLVCFSRYHKSLLFGCLAAYIVEVS